MDVDFIAQIVTISSAIAAGIYYAVLEPLKHEITRLGQLITKFNEDIEKSKDDRRRMGERITRVEESLKSIHKRVDKLEGYKEKMHDE